MYYDPRAKNHGLPHDPFTALVVPRPIGWISTVNRAGRVNLAPYSFFNAVSGRPPFVMFASNSRKDTQRNAEETDEFVVNLATSDLRDEVNATSAPVSPEEDEAQLAGLEMVASVAVKPPRIARTRVALECIRTNSVALVGHDGTAYPTTVIIGEVVGIFIDDAVILNGRVDFLTMRPISRLGYMDYGIVDSIFTMERPAADDLLCRKLT
jgi:flavin reductase (DIM6/NTAB) family NADH-FMN oxidoreductase RutF